MVTTLENVCRAVGYTHEQLRARDRSKTIADARQLACYLLHRRGGMHPQDIGPLFNRARNAAYHSLSTWQNKTEVCRHARAMTIRANATLDALAA